MRKHMVRADAAEDPNVRAKELGDVISKHETAKAKADAKSARADDGDDGSSDDLKQILAALAGIGQRLDKLEAPAAKDEPTTKKADKADTSDEDDDEDDRDGIKKRNRLGKIQARADAVAQARGEQAPPPLSGERVLAYRRRLLRDFRRDSPDTKTVDLETLSGAAFDVIESKIYADAFEAARIPHVPENTLVERVAIDGSGRRISTFYGQPHSWLNDFAGQRQRVISFNNKSSL